MATDPFTLVFDSLWSLLENWTPFTNLVPVGNRIKYTSGTRDPEKELMSTADTPEVRIIPTSSLTHLHRTTNSTSVLQRLEIQTSSGDQRLEEKHFPVKWEVIRALTNWRSEVEALVWNSKKFVKNVKGHEALEGVSEFDINRGIKGWSAIWSCEIEMFFTTADMTNEGI